MLLFFRFVKQGILGGSFHIRPGGCGLCLVIFYLFLIYVVWILDSLFFTFVLHLPPGLCWKCYYLALSHYLCSIDVCQLGYSIRGGETFG